MALAGAFLWGRAALLPSCYFVSRTVDYTNYGSMSVIGMFQQLTIRCARMLKIFPGCREAFSDVGRVLRIEPGMSGPTHPDFAHKNGQKPESNIAFNI